MSQLDLIAGKSQGKIVIAGLSDAGKTSIYKVFFDKLSPADINPMPTQAYSLETPVVDFLGSTKIVCIDMGGQKRFLDQALQQPAGFYTGTVALVYIVDIQNTNNFSLSLEYFQSLFIKISTSTKNKLPVFVFFHKMDPQTDENIDKLRQKLIRELSQQFSDAVDKVCTGCNVRFYQTSIYDLEQLSKAMVDVLSYGLMSEVFQSLVGSIFLQDTHKTIFANYKAMKEADPSNEQTLRSYATTLGINIALMFREEFAKLQLGPDILPSTEGSPTTGDEKSIPSTASISTTSSTNESKKQSFPIIEKLPTNDLDIEFTCPMIDPSIPETRNIDPRYCEITHGLIEGVVQTMGYSKVEMLQTMALHGTDKCKFRAKRPEH